MSNVTKLDEAEILEAVEIMAGSSSWRAMLEFCELRLDQVMAQLADEPDYAMIRYYQGQISVLRELYNIRSAQ